MEGLKEIIIAGISVIGTIAGKEYWDYRKNKTNVEGTQSERKIEYLKKKVDDLETNNLKRMTAKNHSQLETLTSKCFRPIFIK